MRVLVLLCGTFHVPSLNLFSLLIAIIRRTKIIECFLLDRPFVSCPTFYRYIHNLDFPKILQALNFIRLLTQKLFSFLDLILEALNFSANYNLLCTDLLFFRLLL